MKTAPFTAIISGFCGTVLFGFFTAKLFIGSDSSYSARDLVFVARHLDRAEELQSSKGSTTLQLWLQDEPLPFRGSGPYPKYYDPDVMKELHKAVAVNIGVLRTEQTSPQKDYLDGQEFRNIYSLEVNGRMALSLDDHNRWSARNAM